MSSQIKVTVRNLTKSFDHVTAVDHINLEINPGEIFGFLGPNGAGKTTAIRMICGLLKPDEGEVLFNEKNLRQIPNGSALLGLCPQENIHWDRLTCHEQLVFIANMYGLNRRSAKTRSGVLLEQLGLAEHGRKLARKLSGGMKRRLNIALALVHDPQVLILDEPEAGLDPQSRVLMRDFIKDLAGSRTILLTTHNMDEADRLSHRVAIIDQGKILKLDTPVNLKRSIGTNNLLQITLNKALNTTHLNQLKEIDPNISNIYPHPPIESKDEFTMTIHCSDPMNTLPGILEFLVNTEYHSEEVKLRENTLEDVFIQLTGKTLRS